MRGRGRAPGRGFDGSMSLVACGAVRLPRLGPERSVLGCALAGSSETDWVEPSRLPGAVSVRYDRFRVGRCGSKVEGLRMTYGIRGALWCWVAGSWLGQPCGRVWGGLSRGDGWRLGGESAGWVGPPGAGRWGCGSGLGVGAGWAVCAERGRERAGVRGLSGADEFGQRGCG